MALSIFPTGHVNFPHTLPSGLIPALSPHHTALLTLLFVPHGYPTSWPLASLSFLARTPFSTWFVSPLLHVSAYVPAQGKFGLLFTIFPCPPYSIILFMMHTTTLCVTQAGRGAGAGNEVIVMETGKQYYQVIKEKAK